MKNKELIQKLSRLQSRAYKLQIDIQDLVSELRIEFADKTRGKGK